MTEWLGESCGAYKGEGKKGGERREEGRSWKLWKEGWTWEAGLPMPVHLQYYTSVDSCSLPPLSLSVSLLSIQPTALFSCAPLLLRSLPLDCSTFHNTRTASLSADSADHGPRPLSPPAHVRGRAAGLPCIDCSSRVGGTGPVSCISGWLACPVGQLGGRRPT